MDWQPESCILSSAKLKHARKKMAEKIHLTASSNDCVISMNAFPWVWIEPIGHLPQMLTEMVWIQECTWVLTIELNHVARLKTWTEWGSVPLMVLKAYFSTYLCEQNTVLIYYNRAYLPNQVQPCSEMTENKWLSWVSFSESKAYCTTIKVRLPNERLWVRSFLMNQKYTVQTLYSDSQNN